MRGSTPITPSSGSREGTAVFLTDSAVGMQEGQPPPSRPQSGTNVRAIASPSFDVEASAHRLSPWTGRTSTDSRRSWCSATSPSAFRGSSGTHGSSAGCSASTITRLRSAAGPIRTRSRAAGEYLAAPDSCGILSRADRQLLRRRECRTVCRDDARGGDDAGCSACFSIDPRQPTDAGARRISCLYGRRTCARVRRGRVG